MIAPRHPLIALAAMVTLLLLLSQPLLAQTQTVDFEQFTGPSLFGSLQPPVSVGIATFSGGLLLDATVGLVADQTTVYGTAYSGTVPPPICTGCLPTITIDFSQAVSNVSLKVLNGQQFLVTYTVQDNGGGSQVFELDTAANGGQTTVTLPSAGITQVTVTSDATIWDFFIDDVQFSLDFDGDGVPDATDNCPFNFNPNQADKDGDLIGDACDICPNEPGEICSYAETLLPPPTVPQGAPLLVTATFKNDSGADIRTFPPDCFNTYFEVSDGESILFPPHYRHRKAYGIPGDLVTIANGAQVSVTCDLREMFDVWVLLPNIYEVQATYSNYIRDPDLNDDGECAPGREPCSNIWIGFKTSETQQVTIQPLLGGTGLQGINIDIKPGGFPNTWSCKNTTETIPVGLLSSATFDATTVDVNSVRFGKLGTEAAELHRKGGQAVSHGSEDLNGDGLLDKIFHFNAKDTGFSCNDVPTGKEKTVFGYLKGTANGTPIAGADTLRITR
jgi:hypothetical protein